MLAHQGLLLGPQLLQHCWVVLQVAEALGEGGAAGVVARQQQQQDVVCDLGVTQPEEQQQQQQQQQQQDVVSDLGVSQPAGRGVQAGQTGDKQVTRRALGVLLCLAVPASVLVRHQGGTPAGCARCVSISEWHSEAARVSTAPAQTGVCAHLLPSSSTELSRMPSSPGTSWPRASWALPASVASWKCRIMVSRALRARAKGVKGMLSQGQADRPPTQSW